MRAMRPIFTLALLLSAHPGFAGDAPAPATQQTQSPAVAEKAHPDLLQLEKILTRKQDDKKEGRVTHEQYQQWAREFREQLDAVMARVPPSPDNTAAHVRIMSLLGDSEQAQAVMDIALGQNPESPVLLRTKGHILYEQKDFPGAANNALQAWEKSGHTDQAAWALYQMSKGRGAPSGTSSISPEPTLRTQGPAVVVTDESNKPVKLPVKSGAPIGVVPLPNQDESGSSRSKGGLPLWPLAIPFAGGLIAYGLYRGGKQSGEQEPEPPPAEALVSAPLMSGEAAALVGGAARDVAKGAAVKTLGDIAITSAAAVGILLVGGGALILTVNHGLNEMIAAQDKYNEAIDTRRDDEPRSVRPAPIKNKSDSASSSDVFDIRIAQSPFPSYKAIGDIENDCVPGRRIVEPSRSVPGGTSIEQEYICKDGTHTRHTIIDRSGKIVHDHFRPGPPKGNGGD